MSKLEQLIAKYCPNGVKHRELGEIGRVAMCKRIMKAETMLDGVVPFYKIGTFGKAPNAYISVETYERYKRNYSFPRKGDVLISAAGTIGRTIIYDGEAAYYQDSNIVWLEHDESQVINKYLYYCYQLSPWYISTGGTIARLYNDGIAKARIPIPPLSIQQEIVRILDTFTALEAELEAELEARKKQYEYYRIRLIESASSKKDYLGNIARFKYGFTDKAKDTGDARFIRITDIDDNGCLKASDAKYITITDANKNYTLKKEDLLVARTGATYGKTVYIGSDEPAIYASFLIKIEPNANILNSRYYWHYAQTQLYWQQANILVSKAGQPQFNANALTRIEVPLPPLAEQERIVAILDRFDALVNDITQGLPAEIAARRKQYEYYRDKLLTFERKDAAV